MPADKIETISYGKERPAVMGNDEHSWSLNRRTVTIAVKN
jgi:peptidoglycan-associated lipoprotein